MQGAVKRRWARNLMTFLASWQSKTNVWVAGLHWKHAFLILSHLVVSLELMHVARPGNIWVFIQFFLTFTLNVWCTWCNGMYLLGSNLQWFCKFWWVWACKVANIRLGRSGLVRFRDLSLGSLWCYTFLLISLVQVYLLMF